MNMTRKLFKLLIKRKIPIIEIIKNTILKRIANVKQSESVRNLLFSNKSSKYITKKTNPDESMIGNSNSSKIPSLNI